MSEPGALAGGQLSTDGCWIHPGLTICLRVSTS